MKAGRAEESGWRSRGPGLHVDSFPGQLSRDQSSVREARIPPHSCRARGPWFSPPFSHAFLNRAPPETTLTNTLTHPLRLTLPVCAVQCRYFHFRKTLALGELRFLLPFRLVPPRRCPWLLLPHPSPKAGVYRCLSLCPHALSG